MGLFSSVIHLRAVDRDATVDALNRVLNNRGLLFKEQIICTPGGPVLIPGDDEWITRGAYYLASERMEHWLTIIQAHWGVQSAPHESQLAEALSRDLDCYALCLIVHDDDLLLYDLYRSGELLDGYNSMPQYFEQKRLKPRAIEEQRHDPTPFEPLLPPGATLTQLRVLLNAGYWDAYDAGLLDEHGVPIDDSDEFTFESDRMVALGNLLRLHDTPGDYPYAGWRESERIPWSRFLALRYSA